MLVGSVMLATLMQALDTTIANVALPDMQGSLSATQDQASWVLTSYIVAAAILTPVTGWLAARLGRRRLLIIAVSFLPVAGLDMGGCHWHPSLADHARIADALVRHLDALAVGWPRSPHPTAQDDGSVQRDASPHGRRWRNSTRYTPAVHASPAAQPASTSDG